MLELAAPQHNVIALDQLMAVGLSEPAVWKAVAAGRLHRIHRGVYAVGRPDLTFRGRCMAAVLACGAEAFISHATAAALRAIRPSSAARLDVTVMHESPIARPGIRAHRHPDLTPADVTVVDGIPCGSVSLTLLGLATFLHEDRLERACDQAAVMRLLDMREMSDLLARSRGRRGVRRLRNVLARGDLGENVPASGLEVRYRDLCAGSGLPKPEINRYILLGDEYHRVDFLWRKQRVVIETDGGRYHSTGWQRARDAHRDALLDHHGYLHDRVGEDEIDKQPGRAVSKPRDLLAQRERRLSGHSVR